MAQLEQMHTDLHPFAAGIATHLTLFANNNAICSHLPADLARFFSLFPDVRITLEERTSSEVVAAVSGGRADVGIFVKEIIEPDLEQAPYRTDQLVVLTAMGSDLDRGKVRFADCLRHPFICLQQGAALHTFLVNKATDHGSSLDVRIQVSGYRSIAMLVASGAGIGIVPRSVLEISDKERLAEVDLEDAWAIRDLRVCWRHGGRVENRAIDSLVSVLAMKTDVSNFSLSEHPSA
jgi:DNA-binding transcriptional LysR family regulator